MTVKYHFDIDQGSEQWFEIRRGILTASEMKHAISKKKDRKTGDISWVVPEDDKSMSHVYEIAAQRISGYVEPSYVSEDMLRGTVDEITAKMLYVKHVGPIESCGFITNDKWGFTIGYSPDGLVGDDGLVESKSRRQKFQLETFDIATCPTDFYIQVQTGLLVSERKRLHYLSYSAGLHMPVFTIYPDEKVQNAIVEAAGVFEGRVHAAMKKYNDLVNNPDIITIPTERKIEQEIYV